MPDWQYWDQGARPEKNIHTLIEQAHCICLKIGSSLLVDTQHRRVREDWLYSLARDVQQLKFHQKKVIIIASGAIAFAGDRLGFADDDILKKQARAAVGQPRLMNAFARAFDAHHIETAQVLFNPQDTENRRRHLNVRGTLEELLLGEIVPIINENDTVSSQAVRYGDNDRLSARVAGMMNADLLLMFSDVDGLYDSPPSKNVNAKLIAELSQITPQITALAGDTASTVGTGGMTTKLQAAAMCLDSNCHMILTSGKPHHPIRTLLEDAKATIFRAEGTPLQARKRWLAGLLQPEGEIVIDDGAIKALRSGKSLLPAGITLLAGKFGRGDPVAIKDSQGGLIALGLINYAEGELRLIKGKKSTEISGILGYVRENTAVHRDNFTLRS